jgi:hypothetical protein
MHRAFISMTWTPGVEEEDARVMIRAIEDIYEQVRTQFGRPGQFDPLPVVRIFGAWVIPGMPPNAAYSNVNWYVDHSLDDTRSRIQGSRYLEMVKLEPWQSTSPHFDLAMTDLKLVDDLTPEMRQQKSMEAKLPPDSALHVNQPGLFSLISTYPFYSIESSDLRHLAIRHIVAHAFGRLMNVPRRTRKDATVDHLGGCYCTNNCAMRYTDTTTLAMSFAQQELASGAMYCKECIKDLASQVTGFYYGMS